MILWESSRRYALSRNKHSSHVVRLNNASNNKEKP
jgi:hypothetical protein